MKAKRTSVSERKERPAAWEMFIGVREMKVNWSPGEKCPRFQGQRPDCGGLKCKCKGPGKVVAIKKRISRNSAPNGEEG